MRESEVLNIVAEKWLNQPTSGEVQITSCKEMGKRILVKAAVKSNLSRALGKEEWEMIFRMNEAKNRMGYFRSLSQINVIDQFRFASLLTLYEACEAGIKYIHDHYDDGSPQAEELRRDYTKKELKAIADKITAQTQKHISELAVTGQVYISGRGFQAMDELFGMVMFLILGKRVLKEFVSEFNKILPILKNLLSELALKNKRGRIVA